ncbi:unnamed protein product [Clavelina lepadiformis]|uniref:Uncharacterized protein n=1 Tax=Clavelina lepadiformis TaxID=159417 RepID=A0ABP0F2I4_CLALP
MAFRLLQEDYTPWKRRFDSYFGYFSKGKDYYRKFRCDSDTYDYCGFDIWDEPYEEHSAHTFARKVADDSEERHELSEKYPEVVDRLLKRLAECNVTAVPVVYPANDDLADPDTFGGHWIAWAT